MEEENKIEQAVKELLYEQAMREKLQKLENRKSINFYLFRSIAALFILAFGYFTITALLKSELNRPTIIAQNYKFPIITKSRSSDVSIVDAYIGELNEKKYNLVLNKLYEDSLTEKDLFVKANILFVLDSLNESESIIKSSSLTDPFLQSEMVWLNFLIQYKKGKSKSELITLSEMLKTPYNVKAKAMMSALDDE